MLSSFATKKMRARRLLFIPVKNLYQLFLHAAILMMLSNPAHASPLLRCLVSYAGSTHTIETGLTLHPQDVESIDIGGRFRFKADVVIPFMHWGWENEMLASDIQRQLARKMIDAGADAVIGGHPHVVQDTEQYRGKPIIYSIGNFMMDALDNDAQTKGWVVRLILTHDGVQSWDTRLAKIDPRGIPTPVLDVKTPC
ncbi:MAG: CapA family protein [Cytophaga sp.]|nr:CapA family protein [Undibacterium sp.]